MSEYHIAMLRLRNDAAIYYWPIPFKTYNAAWRKLRSLKAHNEARVTFCLMLDEGESVDDFFPDAIEFTKTQETST